MAWYFPFELHRQESPSCSKENQPIFTFRPPYPSDTPCSQVSRIEIYSVGETLKLIERLARRDPENKTRAIFGNPVPARAEKRRGGPVHLLCRLLVEFLGRNARRQEQGDGQNAP